jgi:polyribonucleotide nucleotidyltransferase
MVRRFRRARDLRRAVHGPIALPASATSTASTSSTRRIEQMEDFDLDLVVAGTAERVMMVESEVKELSRRRHARRRVAGHESHAAGDRRDHRSRRESRERAVRVREPGSLRAAANRSRTSSARSVRRLQDQGQGRALRRRGAAREKAKAASREVRREPDGRCPRVFKAAFKEAEAKVVRGDIIRKRVAHRRPQVDQVRPIVSKSASCRARTARRCSPAAKRRRICVATLGTAEDEQYIDGLGARQREVHAPLQLPSLLASVKPAVGGAGRREIGHGKLAWRAVKAVLPKREDFPYTMRSSPRSPSRTARPRWPRSAAPRSP